MQCHNKTAVLPLRHVFPASTPDRVRMLRWGYYDRLRTTDWLAGVLVTSWPAALTFVIVAVAACQRTTRGHAVRVARPVAALLLTISLVITGAACLTAWHTFDLLESSYCLLSHVACRYCTGLQLQALLRTLLAFKPLAFVVIALLTLLPSVLPTLRVSVGLPCALAVAVCAWLVALAEFFKTDACGFWFVSGRAPVCAYQACKVHSALLHVCAAPLYALHFWLLCSSVLCLLCMTHRTSRQLADAAARRVGRLETWIHVKPPAQDPLYRADTGQVLTTADTWQRW